MNKITFLHDACLYLFSIVCVCGKMQGCLKVLKMLTSFLPLRCPPQPILPPAALSAADLERLERVESQLALLWDRVQQGDQKQDERHGNVLGLYHTLKEQLHTETNKESLDLWMSSLLEQRLGILRGELEQENTQREQVKK